jgi:hypothetical protein
MWFFNGVSFPRKAGIQGRGTCGQVWMRAFAGMTLTFLSHRWIEAA